MQARTVPVYGASAARMRQGTKSCAECRRRKVRCSWSNDSSSKCQLCARNKTDCKAQELKDHAVKAARSKSRTSQTASLQARLKDVEGLVQILSQTIRPDIVDDTSDGPLALSDSVPSPYTTSGSSVDQEEETLSHAPLLRLLKDSLAVHAGTSLQPGPQLSLTTRNLLQTLIPDPSALTCVLQASQKFWAIWPLAEASSENHMHCSPSTIPGATTYIHESLRSARPSVVAKCLTWLSLCIQQLPKLFELATAVQLPARPADLIAAYTQEAECILASQRKPDLHLIETLILQYKLFVNMGRPQAAWKATRAAVDHALLLDLHRETADPRKAEVWTCVWQQDRHLSLVLGLPYSVPEHLIRTDEATLSSLPPQARVLHHVNIISGHLIDRDQALVEPPFSTTMRLDEELDELEKLIPREWWPSSSSSDDLLPTTTGGPTRESFWSKASLFFHLHTVYLAHLPYLHRNSNSASPSSSAPNLYAHSRHKVLQTSEQMIQTWRHIRTFDGTPVVCDFLDFFAFASAATLAVDLIATTGRDKDEEDRLWGLVMALAAEMRDTAEVLECAVAAQSAEVLEYLRAARFGVYDGPESYEVTIPHFGRVLIRRPAAAGAGGSTSDPPGKDGNGAHRGCDAVGAIGAGAGAGAGGMDWMPSTVEINSNQFGFWSPAECYSANELAEDWTCNDGGMVEEGVGYDWNAFFDFSREPS